MRVPTEEARDKKAPMGLGMSFLPYVLLTVIPIGVFNH
jgi:hypothetical protein